MLRDRVKDTLKRTEPGDREAHDELQTILARTRGEGRPWWRIPALATASGLLVAGMILVFIQATPPAPTPAPVSAPVPAPTPQPEAALHLYLHVEGEPLEKALRLDLALGKPKGN